MGDAAGEHKWLLRRKKRGLGIEMKTFEGQDGRSYLVFRTKDGAFHAFMEVEAKEAARQCGAREEGNTRTMWERLWATPSL